MTDTTAGITLAAAEALLSEQETFTRPQVAYLLALALDQRHIADIAETVATWQEKHQAHPGREDRVADRVAEMTKATKVIHRQRGWPEGYEYTGGPVDWETGLALHPVTEAPFMLPPSLVPDDPDRVRPKFPTLEEQTSWLGPEGVEFCRRDAHQQHGAGR